MSDSKKSILLATVAILSWSTVATAFKIALRELSVYEMLLVASVTALLVMAGWITVTNRWKEILSLPRKAWAAFAILGLINPVCYYLILFQSYDMLPAQVAQPINYLWPLVLLILIALFTRTPIPGRKYIGMAVSLAGLTVISFGGKAIEGNLSPVGIAIGFGSAFFWALYWLINDKLKHLASDSVSVFLGFLFGTVYLLLGTTVVPVHINSAAGLASGVYIGLFEMGIPFLCFGSALRLTKNPTLINQLCYLSPFMSLIFIAFILHEPIVPSTYIGLILIVAGLIYNQYFASPQKSKRLA